MNLWEKENALCVCCDAEASGVSALMAHKRLNIQNHNIILIEKYL